MKIQGIIDKYKMNDIVVPKKYLYYNNGQWHVIAKKITLDSLDPERPKELSPKQANELAIICFEGRLVDISRSNINFTPDGKLALVDTEPTTRAFYKAMSPLVSFFLKNFCRFVDCDYEASKILMLCQNDDATQEAQTVRRRMLFKKILLVGLQALTPILLWSKFSYSFNIPRIINTTISIGFNTNVIFGMFQIAILTACHSYFTERARTFASLNFNLKT